MEYPKPFPFPGTASEYPAQREGCGPLTDSVSRPGDSGDAATELTDLVGRLVVSLLRQGRAEVSRIGLGVVGDSRGHHDAQPAHLLLVRGVPGSVRGRQRGVGTVAVRSRRALDQARVCDANGADGHSNRPDGNSAAGGRDLHSLRRDNTSSATEYRKSPTRTATAVVCRSIRLGGDDVCGCGFVQQLGTGRPRQDGYLWAELRAGRGHRSFWS